MTTFGSLGARIYGVAGIAAAITLVLGALLLQNGVRSQEAFGWVRHTQDVIISLDALEGDLGRAESSLRGYLLTSDQSYLAGFDRDVAEAGILAAKVSALVADNPLQAARAARLSWFTAEKGRIMALAARRSRVDPRGWMPDPTERQRDRGLMTAVAREVETMRGEERRLLAVRTARAQTETARAKSLLLYGWPIVALMIGGIAWLIRTGISRPLADLLDAVARFGAGQRDARVVGRARSAEFGRLALAYNDMADRLGVSMEQQDVRQRSVALLSEMSRRLQAIQTEGELSEVLDCFMARLLPEQAGALYLHNHSRNMLFRISSWGNPRSSPEMFPPANCWGLRRGQAHSVAGPGKDLFCAHAAASEPVERLCEPVLAGGEVLGLLYVEGHLAEECRFRLTAIMENVALALVNENLRARLREQSIRDPLTGLFNRRYMEESLALEMARAERSDTPLSIVMCDIDHFKRFNDGHGHAAGDVLLAAIAALVQSQFRQGDIVCRYGGEEFTVIAPGASLALVRRRVDALGAAVREMTVEYQGRRLGPVTMSFGIDSWAGGDPGRLGSMMAEADRALFRAKELGRDRAECSPSALRTVASAEAPVSLAG